MVDNFASPPQTFSDHIRELRKRLTWSALAFIVGGTIGYLFHKQLIVFLKRPLHESLYFTSPAGSFNFVMKICFMIGLAVALPVIIYNLAAFIRPAFPKQMSRRVVRNITLLSLILAFSGAAFAFFLVVPMSLHFFMGFAVGGLKPLISADDYLRFITNCIISFVVIFQTPLVILFIDRIKPLPPKKLLKYEKFVIVGSLALAVILPFTYDPLTQFLLAVPIIVLYNLSILLLMVAHRKPKATKTKKAAHVPTPVYHKPVVAPVASLVPVTAAAVAERPSTSKVVSKPATKPAVRPGRSVDGLSYPSRRNFLDLTQSQRQTRYTLDNRGA